MNPGNYKNCKIIKYFSCLQTQIRKIQMRQQCSAVLQFTYVKQHGPWVHCFSLPSIEL